MATYHILAYDNEADGPFVEGGDDLTWTDSTGEIIEMSDSGTFGLLYIELLTGTPPIDNQEITQNTTTADVHGDPLLIDYPSDSANQIAAAVWAWQLPVFPDQELYPQGRD